MTTETHFPTPHIAWFLVDHNGSAPSDGMPRICCYNSMAPHVRYATLRQKWLPMVAGQGREAEWRDIQVMVQEPEGV